MRQTNSFQKTLNIVQMKNLIILLSFVVLFSCNSSSSGTTPCTVEIYTHSSLPIYKGHVLHSQTEARIKNSDKYNFKEGQDVWVYCYKKNGNSEHSTWIVSNNPYGKDTMIIEEVVPQANIKFGYYRKAKLVKL